MEPYDKTACIYERYDFDNTTRIVIDSSGNVYEKLINKNSI